MDRLSQFLHIIKQATISLFIASLVIFFIMEILPGDPASVMLGMEARADSLHALRLEMGLDLPLWQRYGQWILGLIQFNLGLSYAYHSPIADLILDKLMLSLPLSLYTLALSLWIAMPLILIAHDKKHPHARDWIGMLSKIFILIPNFWIGILLIFIFSIHLKWFTTGGYPPMDYDNILVSLFLKIKSLTLPALALALPQAGITIKIANSALDDVNLQNYIRTAHAKGLETRQVTLHHALPNIMVSLLTLLGLQFSFLLAGTIIIENVFYLPGLGRFLFQAVQQRDLIAVKNIVMFLVFIMVIVNMVINLICLYLDPRLIRKQEYGSPSP